MIRATAVRFQLVNLTATAVLALGIAGCFYPTTMQPPSRDKTSVVVQLPYDLAWNAVNEVIKKNALHVNASNPNHGIIEAAGPRFTLSDADCGEISSVAGSYLAEPQLDSSSVYSFKVTPNGNEATSVEVHGTFSSSLRVPLKPYSEVQCVSRGTAESRLLREVLATARNMRRPEPELKSPPSARQPLEPLTPGRPTLLKDRPPSPFD